MNGLKKQCFQTKKNSLNGFSKLRRMYTIQTATVTMGIVRDFSEQCTYKQNEKKETIAARICFISIIPDVFMEAC